MLFIVTVIFRWKSKSKALETIFTITFGINFYLLLFTDNIIQINYISIIAVTVLYTAGVKFMKLSLFKSLIDQKITYRKRGLSRKENRVAILVSVTLTAFVGDTLMQFFLIVFCYLIAICANANIFNPFFYKEQVKKLKEIENNPDYSYNPEV